MSQVLYRKYRSQTFDEIVGQAHITDILKNAVSSKSIAHAYLLVGSRGTGKTSMARILAKAINCHELTDTGNPCDKCDACVAIRDGAYLDLIEIDAASNRGIDQIRELKEKIEFAPVEGKYKVYIIDEVHMLTTEAFNALLKTLEEPPPHVIFILATTDVHKLPATILSRCQRYDFRLGTDDQIREVLLNASGNESVKISLPALELLVKNAHGSYRDALSLLDVVISGQIKSDKPEEVSENEVRSILGIPDATMVIYLLEKLVARDAKDALKMIKELESKGVNLSQFVHYIQMNLRDLLIEVLTDELDSEHSFAKDLTEKDVLRLINLFLDAEKKLRTASVPALVLEMVVAEFITTGLPSVAPKVVRHTAPPVGIDKSPVKKVEEISETLEVSTEELNDSTDTSIDDVTSEVVHEIVDEVGEESVEVVDVTAVNSEATESVPETPGVATKDFTLDFVTEHWVEVTKKIQVLNGHLYAFLKTAKLTQIQDGFLILEVPFEFHKDRIESANTREMMSDITKEVYGNSFVVKCNVNENIQRKKEASASVLESIKVSAVKAQNEQAKAAEPAPKAEPKKEVPERKVSKKVEAIFADM